MIAGVIILVFVTNKKLTDRIFAAEITARQATYDVEFMMTDISTLKSFISTNSKEGKVYFPLIKNSNKKFKDNKKLPTYYLCANDEFSSVLKFNPQGYFNIWSETKDNIDKIKDINKSETGYYTITKGKIKILMFDRDKTMLEEFKIKKTNKYNVITELELLGNTFNSKQCPKGTYNL